MEGIRKTVDEWKGREGAPVGCAGGQATAMGTWAPPPAGAPSHQLTGHQDTDPPTPTRPWLLAAPRWG